LRSGYDAALSQAYEELASLAPETVCERSGVRYSDGEYYLQWLSEEKALSKASTAHKIVWIHYMTTRGIKDPSGRLMPYRDAPGGALFYDANFTKRVIRPFVKTFGNDLQSLYNVGEVFGGQKVNNGDASIVLKVLPYMPITYILWSGDEEFEPTASVLFDETAKSWLCAEDLVILASLSVYELIGYKKSNFK
jgi:hypothetical protein